MKRKLEKIIKNDERVEDMHKLQLRINLLTKRVAKGFAKTAYRAKAEAELVEAINKFIYHINDIKKEETHEVYRRGKNKND